MPRHSFRALVPWLAVVACTACTLDAESGSSSAPLTAPSIATMVGPEIVVHEAVLRSDIDGASILAFDVQHVGDVPYLVRHHVSGDRVANEYVRLEQIGDDFFLAPDMVSTDCGWCHRDDGDCVACRLAIVAPHGTTACVCSDGEPGHCESTGEFQIGADDVYAF